MPILLLAVYQTETELRSGANAYVHRWRTLLTLCLANNNDHRNLHTNSSTLAFLTTLVALLDLTVIFILFNTPSSFKTNSRIHYSRFAKQQKEICMYLALCVCVCLWHANVLPCPQTLTWKSVNKSWTRPSILWKNKNAHSMEEGARVVDVGFSPPVSNYDSASSGNGSDHCRCCTVSVVEIGGHRCGDRVVSTSL